MAHAYVLISYHEPTTYAHGIYKSESRAWKDAAKMLIAHTLFPRFAKVIRDEFGLDITQMNSEQLGKLLRNPEQVSDEFLIFLSEHLFIRVEKVQVGTLFKFDDWCNWDSRSLYDAVRMILQGQYGTIGDAWLYKVLSDF